MASVAQEQLVTISINDIELQVPKDELIVESAKRLGLEIPIFCYHPRMKAVGMCRMCLVEVGFKQPDGSVRKMPKPQAGCTLPASEGMVIYTDTEQIHRDRRGVLEFLLINHPLDCPICDRGGECPLQNNTLAYGPSTSRFIEMKRHLPKAYPLSQFVTLDLERCIQCGRCVRFTEEISGDAQLAFRFRGASMQPSTFQLTDFESKFSGNTIEICPVGALTSSRYRFRARPWDLETGPGICTVTPDGTNVYFDHRAGRFIRITGRTNEEVNEEWTSDKCKFGHDFYNAPDRILAPNRRVGDSFAPCTWSEANREIAETLSAAGANAALLVSPRISNESIFEAQKLFRGVLGRDCIDYRMGEDQVAPADRVEQRLGVGALQVPIAQLEHLDSVLIFGTSLADEQPITYLRIRKGWFRRGMKVVVAHDAPTDADSFAAVILRYQPGSERFAAAALASALGQAPDVDFERALRESGLAEAEVRSAAEALSGSSRAIICTHSLTKNSDGVAAYQTLAGLAGKTETGFNYMGLHCNSQGAIELGALPKSEDHGTRQILEAAANGQIKCLFLMDVDPIVQFPDTELAVRALENVEYLVYGASDPGPSAAYASAILPMALPAEQDGTYTSSEGRVQRMSQVLTNPGESKAPWRIFTELALRIRPGTPAFNPREIMEEIAGQHPHFESARYANLPVTGTLVKSSPRGYDSEAFAGILAGLR